MIWYIMHQKEGAFISSIRELEKNEVQHSEVNRQLWRMWRDARSEWDVEARDSIDFF